MLIKDAFDLFLTEITINKAMASTSIASYQSDLKQYLIYIDELGIERVEEITKEHIYTFIMDQLQKKSKSSVGRMISSIRAFHSTINIHDNKIKDPTVNIHTIQKTRYLPKYFNKRDLDLLFDSFSDSTIDLFHHTIFELLYACGLRVSELCSLSINQYNRANGFIKIIGKGNKERIVPIAKYSARLLDQYIDEVRIHYNKKGLSNLFVNRLGNRLTRQYVGVMLKSKEKELGISLELSPHSFRHTFASDLLANNADLRIVQELLGHSDISTTQIYTHVNKDQLHKAYDKFHPGNRRSNKK